MSTGEPIRHDRGGTRTSEPGDTLAIQQVILQVARNADQGRATESVRYFADDAVLDLGDRQVRGNRELEEFFGGGRPPEGDREPTKHVISNALVTVRGDQATTTSYFQVLRSFGLWMWGRYEDRWARIDGHWKIVERRVSKDGQSARPS